MTRVYQRPRQIIPPHPLSTSGFTLIELLVVIIILGILSAIALPAFLNQVNKAKQAEARNYIGIINRAQQAFYLENGTFAEDIALLDIGLESEKVAYDYRITTTNKAQYVVSVAIPTRNPDLKAYVGPVKIGKTDPNDENIAAVSLLCEAILPEVQNSSPLSSIPTTLATDLSLPGSFGNLLDTGTALTCGASGYKSIN